jgi:hypothetical protein
VLEEKPWQRFDPAQARRLPATLGVYQLADEEGRLLYIGMAGAREPFGLRGRLLRHFDPAQEPNPVIRQGARCFRYEVNLQYTSRWLELLGRYLAQQGQLPPANQAAPWELPPSFRKKAASK